MGKRKRRADHNKTPPPPELETHSSQIDSLPEQKSSRRVDGSAMKPPSIMDSIDNSVGTSRGDQSIVHPRHTCSRAMLLKHHRQYFGRHYSRRSACNHAEASTSHGKGASPQDEKLYFKPSSRCNSELEQSIVFSESGNQPFCKPEKIRNGLLAKHAAPSSNAMRMVCGICEKLLRKKPLILDNSTSSSDLSAVVAVLVCGHAYHADCLEQRTCQENRQDPPCPLCASASSEVDASAV